MRIYRRSASLKYASLEHDRRAHENSSHGCMLPGVFASTCEVLRHPRAHLYRDATGRADAGPAAAGRADAGEAPGCHRIPSLEHDK